MDYRWQSADFRFVALGGPHSERVSVPPAAPKCRASGSVPCRYEDIADTTGEVLSNHDRAFERIHGHAGLPTLLQSMKNQFGTSRDSVLARFPY
jgi:hypothetical protein